MAQAEPRLNLQDELTLLFTAHALPYTASKRLLHTHIPLSLSLVPKIAALTFQTAEPGDDPLGDQMFDVLHDALQPDTKVYSDPAANDILGLLSEHKPSFMEVDTFNMTCIEIAEELPDDHPSMAKLLITLAFVHSDPKFMEGESDSSLPSTVKWSVLVWTSGLQPQQYYRYQKLKEAYHDELSSKHHQLSCMQHTQRMR